MQQVKIFSASMRTSLEAEINKWLESGYVVIQGISYSADYSIGYYSAMVYFVPSQKALMKQWRESN